MPSGHIGKLFDLGDLVRLSQNSQRRRESPQSCILNPLYVMMSFLAKILVFPKSCCFT
jgi:hypothetical protein